MNSSPKSVSFVFTPCSFAHLSKSLKPCLSFLTCMWGNLLITSPATKIDASSVFFETSMPINQFLFIPLRRLSYGEGHCAGS